LIDQTAEFMRIYFGTPVEVLECRPLGDIPETARRMRDGEEQVLTTWILEDVLVPNCPEGMIAVIGLVTCDLWPGNLNWVFGQASMKDRVGVWSLHRNGDPRASAEAYRLCLRRTLKTAVHETGHMLGIPHCAAYECCMNGSRSRDESDRQPLEFCPECQPKIWWTCGADPIERSRGLARFAVEQRLQSEASLWERQVKALSGRE
jgi:archaemetzincin